MNLWDKGVKPDRAIIEFTSGGDREFDNLLTAWDIAGSMAHVIMLFKTGLLQNDEMKSLVTALNSLHKRYLKGNLRVIEGVEDVHSLIEDELSGIAGATGKKVHTGRSRNDQVLTDLRLYTRYQTDRVANAVSDLAQKLLALSNTHREIMLPGYTHMQPAMVSTFGLWFGGYAEALTDDLVLLGSSRKLNNRSPLGTAAGYGTTLPIDRDLTASLLDFDELILNSTYASVSRGKAECATASALGSIAGTLSKLSADICLFMTAEFRFIEFPDELITGSSIMPQKKNPDVFEIIRARSNSVISSPNEIRLILSNLPSGYHRDLQEIKRIIMKDFTDILSCLDIMNFMLGGIRIKSDLVEGNFYDQIFSTEAVYRLVRSGVPFRDAYQEVAGKLKEGNFPRTSVNDYTHKGSAGNLCNDEILARLESLMGGFVSLPSGELIDKLVKESDRV